MKIKFTLCAYAVVLASSWSAAAEMVSRPFNGRIERLDPAFDSAVSAG